MSVNYRVLRIELARQSPKVIAKAEPVLERRFDENKDVFLAAFDAHPVTKEIRGGPTVQESILGYGNLFSFLGFERDEKPVTPLRAWLKQAIRRDGRPKVAVEGGVIVLRQNVSVPTLDDVNAAANEKNPLDSWAGGRAWTDLIEKGIPGFARFLSIYGGKNRRKHMDDPPSRSGTAIQVKTKNLREGRPGPISYLSGLLAAFKASISSNRR